MHFKKPSLFEFEEQKTISSSSKEEMTPLLFDMHSVAFVLREVLKQGEFYNLLKGKFENYPATGTETIDGKKESAKKPREVGIRDLIEEKAVNEDLLRVIILVLSKNDKTDEICAALNKSLKNYRTAEDEKVQVSLIADRFSKTPLEVLEFAVAALPCKSNSDWRHRFYGILMLLYTAKFQGEVTGNPKASLSNYLLDLLKTMMVPQGERNKHLATLCKIRLEEIRKNLEDFQIKLGRDFELSEARRF